MTRLDPAALGARRVLAVAPHPDDESLGCGGLLALLARDDADVHVLFVTDGGASHLHSPTWPRERLAVQREKEASDALERLGLGGHGRSFLRLPDAEMPTPGSREHEAALARVARLLAGFPPDVVLLPWRRDPHRDHRDAHALVTAAMTQAGTDATTLEYAVWLDEFGEPEDRPRAEEVEALDVDISDVVDAKRRAVAAHLSQTTDLIADDPDAFRLSPETIARLTGPHERYLRPL